MSKEHFEVNSDDDKESKSPANKWEALVEEETRLSETPSLEHPSYEDLETKLTELEAKAADLEDKFIRAEAKADNIRRRADQDIENARKYSLKDLAQQLLPVIDSLERSLEMHGDEMEAIKEGVELTLKMFLDALAKFGVIQVSPLGQPFSPTLHEAVAMEPSNDVPNGTVLKVFQKGYQLNDRLIRPAMVVVAKAP